MLLQNSDRADLLGKRDAGVKGKAKEEWTAVDYWDDTKTTQVRTIMVCCAPTLVAMLRLHWLPWWQCSGCTGPQESTLTLAEEALALGHQGKRAGGDVLEKMEANKKKMEQISASTEELEVTLWMARCLISSCGWLFDGSCGAERPC